MLELKVAGKVERALGVEVSRQAHVGKDLGHIQASHRSAGSSREASLLSCSQRAVLPACSAQRWEGGLLPKPKHTWAKTLISEGGIIMSNSCRLNQQGSVLRL